MDIKEFKSYFDAVNLGSLHYPGEQAPVDLNKLYRLVTGCRPGEETRIDHILGILMFGEALATAPYQPHVGGVHNPDFLVLTNDGHSISDHIPADYDFTTVDKSGPKIKSPGIYLFFKNIYNSTTRMYRSDDRVTQAMKQGALIVYDKRINDFAHETNISLPKRQVVWSRDTTGNLEGRIN